ncbi:MAG: DUF1178 family protein [Hyphomicrobiales bacterium]
MIKFSLICGQGHEFDGWFRNGAAFDEQAAAGDVPCPVCGSQEVSKALMAPGIPAKSNAAPESVPTVNASGDAKAAELIRQLRQMRDEVEKTSEYVGDKFPDEARRIHYEEAEKRGIHGEASVDDARELIDEGVEVFPLPKLPEDHN